MKIFQPLYLPVLIFSLTGCFGLGFGSCGEDNCDGTDMLSTISLNDFVGVWDGSRDIDSQRHDESYMVVKASGEVTYYDYQGDAYNMGNNCYLLRAIKLTDSGKLNSFTHPVTIDGRTKLEAIKVELYGAILAFTYPAYSTTTPGRFEYSPSTMTEPDFSPACLTD